MSGINTGSNYIDKGYVKTEGFKAVQKLPSGISQAAEAKNLGKTDNRFDNEVSTNQSKDAMLKDLNGAIASGSNEIRLDKNTVITKEQAIGLRDAIMKKGIPDITNKGVFKSPAFAAITVNNGEVNVKYAEKAMSSDQLRKEFIDISNGEPVRFKNTYTSTTQMVNNPSPQKAWGNLDIKVIPNNGDVNQSIIKSFDEKGVYRGTTPEEKVAVLNLLKLSTSSPVGFDQEKFKSNFDTSINSGKPKVQIDAQNNTFAEFANGATLTMNPRVGAEIYMPGNPMTIQHIDPDTQMYKDLENSLRPR